MINRFVSIIASTTQNRTDCQLMKFKSSELVICTMPLAHNPLSVEWDLRESTSV